jgi:hypothetical protein
MPMLPYLMTAAGLLSTLALFITLKREIYRQAQRQKNRLEEMAARFQETVSAPPPSPAEPEPLAVVPAPLRSGMNLNRRVHAMRMLRRGEEVSHIAAALGVPRKEIELLIRVQSIGKARVAGAD